MNKILLFVSLLLTVSGYSQINTPAASPACKITQTVGLTDVTIEYSRPSVKDRTIFSTDGLVPYGKKWRLGANAVTKISFSDDVTVNGSAMAKGDYAVIATPSAAAWDFHFFPYTERSWSKYTEMVPAATVSGKVSTRANSVETFTIMTANHTDSSADLVFQWAKSSVSLNLATEVDSRVMKNIESVMAGPSAGEYYSAASYYHSSGKDLGQALAWIEKATAGDDKKFWQVRRKALILADMGKTKDAVAAATMSMELAQKAGNDEYVKMNKESIAMWSKK